MTTIKGQCLCGDVQFKTPEPNTIDACHCGMCQKWAGGAFIGADYFQGGVTITKDDGLTWYASSDWAKRGFCKTCGSSLFYRLNDHEDFWAICAGSLDLPDGMTLGKEIFIDKKPTYYTLAGDHPRLTGKEFFASLQERQDD